MRSSTTFFCPHLISDRNLTAYMEFFYLSQSWRKLNFNQILKFSDFFQSNFRTPISLSPFFHNLENSLFFLKKCWSFLKDFIHIGKEGHSLKKKKTYNFSLPKMLIFILFINFMYLFLQVFSIIVTWPQTIFIHFFLEIMSNFKFM